MNRRSDEDFDMYPHAPRPQERLAPRSAVERDEGDSVFGRLFSAVCGEDPGTRSLVAMVLVVCLLIGAAIVWWVYRGPSSHSVPIIGPPPGPARERPVDSGESQFVDTTLGDADQMLSSGMSAPKLAPPPERPDMRVFDSPTKPEESGKEEKPATGGDSFGSALPPVPGQPPETAPAKPVHPVKAEKSVQPAKPVKPAVQPVKTAKPERFIKPGQVRKTGNNWQVQLGAVPDRAAADKLWRQIRHGFPGQVKGKKVRFVSGRSRRGAPFVRVRLGPFGSASEARNFCKVLKSRSKACVLADF